MNELVRYDAMCSAISECHNVDEVKDIRDKALALESYARQAMNTDAERKATEIRIRAERRAGQMMREMERSEHRLNGKDKNNQAVHAELPEKSEYAQAKQTANISDTQAKRWQKLAAVEDKEFESAINSPAMPSTTGILKSTVPPTAEKPMDEDALWLWGRFRDFEARNINDVDFLMSEMTDTMQSEVKRIAESMTKLCEEILSHERFQ